MSDDLIKRSDAIKAVEECLKLLARPRYTVKTAIEAIPSVVIPHSDDWEKYSDKLWQNAYERGKADRPQGEWIPCTKGGLPLAELGRRERQKWYGYKCSKCNFIYKGNALTESPFCQNCGCRMKGADDA